MDKRVKIHLPHTSIMMTSGEQIQSICQWMFDELNFDFFVYSHVYDNGKNFALANDKGDGLTKSWLHRYYLDNTHITIEELEQIRGIYNNPLQMMSFFTSKITVTDQLSTHLKHRKNIQLGEYCNIRKRFYLAKRYKDYIELVEFGSSLLNDDFYSICIQNLSVFYDFIQYFKKQAASVINVGIQEAIVISSPLPNPSSHKNHHFTGYDFFNKRKIRLQLTNQEAKCIQPLLQGKTFKETAKLVGLSPRTVEGYIGNVKNKTNCNTTSELIDLLSRFISN